MMRMTCGAALAALLTTTATADVPPPMPDKPLSETCKPFIGVWARQTPRVTRNVETSTVIAIDSEEATVLTYVNQMNVNIDADTDEFYLTCAAQADGSVRLTFADDDDRNDGFTLDATLAGDGSFTTKEQTSYLHAGPPDPNWKPETVTVIWTRIGR